MNSITIDIFNHLPLEEQWQIFCEGIPIGERTISSENNQICFSWARQIDDFYIIQKLFFGKRVFEAVKDVNAIERYLEDFHINWYALGIMKDEEI